MVGNCATATNTKSAAAVLSSSKTESSKDRTDMADSRENRINQGATGSGLGGKKTVGGGGTGKLERFLASREDNKFPSDTEDSALAAEAKGKKRWGKIPTSQVNVGPTTGGGQGLELADLLNSGGKGSKRGVGGGNVNGNASASGGSSNGPLPSTGSQSQQRFTRAPQVVDPNVQVAPPQTPVKLTGLDNTSVAKTNQVAPAFDTPGGNGEGRKRKPRMDVTLRICRDFTSDILSRKHKDWAWPLYKIDKAKAQGTSSEIPLFLLEIKNKFADRKYSTLQEFHVDIKKLVKFFCIHYTSDHQYAISARKLESMFDTEYKKIEDNEATRRKSGRGRQSKGPPFGRQYWVDGVPPGWQSVPVDNNVPAPAMDLNQKNSSCTVFGGGTGVGFENLVTAPVCTTLLRSPNANGPAVAKLNTNENILRRSSFVDGRAGIDALPKRTLESRGDSESESSSEPNQEEVATSQPLSLGDTWNDVFSNRDSKENNTAHSPTGKRKLNGVSDGGQEKRLHVNPSVVAPAVSANPIDCNIGLVKQERVSEEDNDVEDRHLFEQQFLSPPPPRNYQKCKWLMDGINVVVGREAVMREIKNLIRADEDVAVDLQLLESLEDGELASIAEIVRRHLFEAHPRPYQQQVNSAATQVLSAEFRAAFGLINEAFVDSDRVGRETRLIQDMTFNLLTRLNALQNQNLMDLNKWHDRKMTLMGCRPPSAQH